ncbi:hypothetical protein Tco_0888035, partial [Tanacetum coccineum]
QVVKSDCTTALDVVPWETDGESVLRESCQTRASQVVKSGCTTALDVVPWETDDEYVLRESCQTRSSMTNTQTPPPETTVVNSTGAPVTNTVANHAERPEKFNG